MSNALADSGDPGFMNGKIFQQSCGKGVRDFISIRSDLNCESALSSTAYSSVAEYSSESTSSMSFDFGLSFEGSFSLFGFGAQASAAFAMNRNSDSSSAANQMSSFNGEIIVAKG
jgi:hypothetical protein